MRSGAEIVYEVPATGAVCTSDALPQGAAIDTYEFVYESGQRIPLRVPNEVDKLATVNGSILYVYVGSPSEQAEARAHLPR